MLGRRTVALVFEMDASSWAGATAVAALGLTSGLSYLDPTFTLQMA
jgi:hypothetical protein